MYKSYKKYGVNREEYLNFERNYNELLQSYYIKSNEKLLNERFPSSAFMPTSTTGSSTPDEVYRQRLNSIPSAVKLVYNGQVRNHIVYYLDRMNNYRQGKKEIETYKTHILELLDRVDTLVF